MPTCYKYSRKQNRILRLLVKNSLQKASLRYAFCAPICRSRGLCGKVKAALLLCCHERRREKPRAERKRTRGFSENHEDFSRQFGKNL